MAPGPIKVQTFQKSKAAAMGLSMGCEPGALQPPKPPLWFQDPFNTHTTKPGARDPGITVQHKELLYFSSHAMLWDCEKRNAVLSQINLL